MRTSPIPGPWLTVAARSGHLDLRPILARLDVSFEDADVDALVDAGLPLTLARQCVESAPMETRDPWIPIGAPDYPQALLSLDRPPPLISLRGAAGRLREPGIAVVGARSCTAYGRRVASRIAGVICAGEGIVVSGAARGIDAAAHRAAGGHTIAVLGAGLDAPASAGDRQLRRQILDAGGLLISEWPPMSPPQRWTFPLRNRLIAALGRATVVVEASTRSGALITARRAVELGREVLAVPGPVDAPASAGALALIAGGATCLTSPGEIAERLPSRPLSGRLGAALECPGSAAEIARRAGLELGEALRLLAMLELTGAVRRLPDHRYARSRPAPPLHT